MKVVAAASVIAVGPCAGHCLWMPIRGRGWMWQRMFAGGCICAVGLVPGLRLGLGFAAGRGSGVAAGRYCCLAVSSGGGWALGYGVAAGLGFGWAAGAGFAGMRYRPAMLVVAGGCSRVQLEV